MANRITTTFRFSEEGRGLSKIKADIQGVDGAWNKARVGFSSALTEFRNSGAAQAVAGAAVLKVAKDAVNASSALEESANAVNTTFEDASGDIADLADDAVEKYGLSKRAFNELAVAFSGFATKIVGEGGDVAGTIDVMATRVADFASVHNLELSDAMTKFQSALAGETEAMRRYGIDVSAAAVEQYALAAGLVASKSEMTEAIKVQARYGLLLQETDQWAGDFAATSDSLANSQRILAANIENLQAQLGNHLVPALAEATSNLNELLSIAEELKLLDMGAEFAKWADPSPTGTIKKFRELRDLATDTKFRLEDFDGTAEELRTTLEGLGFDQDEVNKAVEFYAKKQGEATAATGEAVAVTSNYTHAQNLVAEAIQQATYAQQHSNKSLDKAREFAQRAAQFVANLGTEWDRLKGKLSDESAHLAAMRAFESLGAEAQAALDAGSAATLEQKQALVDLKLEVGNYLVEVGKIPPNVATTIVANMDTAGVANIQALIASWTSPHTVPLVPRVINTGGARIRVDPSGNVHHGASGGVVTQPTLAVIGESGPEAVVPLNQAPGASPLPTGAGGGGVHIGELHLHTAASNPDQFARDVRKALEREMRWNGDVSGWGGR